MDAPQALQPDLFGPPGTDIRVVLAPPLPPVPPAPGRSRRGPKPTALSVCVLGSGSGGNASVLRPPPGGGDRPVLIDAGFGPRTTTQRLAQAGLTLAELGAVYVTHFDTDHFRPGWVRAMVDLKLKLRCHRWHLPDLRRVRDNQRLFAAGLVEPFDDTPFTADGFAICPIRLQHDRQGTIGYRFTRGGVSLGYATDLGHAPEALCRHLAGVDVLCLESNYDERMTKDSPRPAFVNRRNLSDSGHLSNDQALAAVRRIGELSPHSNPRRVVLLHRSAQCNHPTKVRRCFAQDPAIARRVVLTDQRRRSRWIGVAPLRAVRRAQLTLAHCG
ncbi:MAG: MBL fold metallo-hydrolase [Planctomycetota bacterium]